MLSNAKIYKFISYIVIIVLFYFSFEYIFFDNRSQYERFLISEYSKIPEITEQELKDIPEPEHPHLATYQNFFMTLDPKLGYVPADRLKDAFRIRENIQSPRFRDVSWNSIQSNMGGRTRALMYDPNDISGNKVWAGSVSGGLWYNNNINDENSSWVSVNDFWDNLSVSAIAFDPNNNNVFYVGTGEANTATITYRESSSKGVGVWKSVDSGFTWSLLESTEDFDYITDIEIKNNNGVSEVYLGVASGTYQGEVHESEPSDGVYKSIDNGDTWIQVLPNISDTNTPYTPSDIEILTNGKILIGTMKNLNGQGGAVILSSDNGNPNSWNVNNYFQDTIINSSQNNIPGRIILSSCDSSPDIVFGVVGAGYLNSMNFNLSHGDYIIKSNNSGESWTFISLPTDYGNEWASLAWHALAISVHPENPDIVFIGGLEVYRSLNGGDSWQNLSDWDLMYYGGGSRYVHADIHSIIFQPNNSDAITISSDGGLFNSINAIDSDPVFFERNKAYNTLQFYTCDISPEIFGDSFVGGLQDNGTLISGTINNDNEFDINDMISGGDGAYCFFDDDEPLLITSTYYNYYFLFNTENDNYTYANGNSGVFINPSAYNSSTNTLYANKVRFNGSQANRLIKINNFSSDNLESDNINFETISLGTNSSVYFSSIKLSPYSDNIYLGSQSGKLFKIENIDTNPATYNIGSDLFPTANISSVDIGTNESEILVIFSNYGVSSIWYSNDSGSNWQEKQGNLPDFPIRYGIFNNDNSNYAMIATEIGIWETNNLLSEEVFWFPSNNGIGNVRVDMLSYRDSDNLLLAATHGRGMFYGTYSTDLNGDLNSDNNLDILDIVLLVNLVINNDYDHMADINEDNTLNILDIVLLVNLVLNS